MENTTKESLFTDRSQALVEQRDEGAVARAVQEVQAALVIAQKFPRDEVRCKTRIIEACKRKGLAELSEYEYSRGGTRITGPTIDLLRAIANRWGNLLFGWAEVERREGLSMIRCWAWDTQNNSRAERTFAVKHWRDTQGGGYALKDERDIYELLANNASRRVRACLEEVIDSDVIQDAIDQCHKTLKEGEKLPIKDRAVAVVLAFAEFGVTQGMIEKRIGNKFDAISENQLASLRRVFKSLKDGVGQREDFFKADPVDPNLPGQQGSQPETTANPQTVQSEAAAPGSAPTPEPVKSKPKQRAPLPPAQTPLAKLRELARADNVKEGELLSFLASNQSTDGSCDTLETLVMQFPQVVSMCVENWTELSARIQGA